jgi:hypothetical protein
MTNNKIRATMYLPDGIDAGDIIWYTAGEPVKDRLCAKKTRRMAVRAARTPKATTQAIQEDL